MKELRIQNYGMIRDAKLSLADLNIFVGPQASGKSLVLQLIKLLEDKKYITQQLEQYNYSWNDLATLSEIYYGEGMDRFLSDTQVSVGKTKVNLANDLKFKKGYAKGQTMSCFYMPAQRVLVIEDGWPKAFESFDNSYPYVIREYSNVLRSTLNKFNAEEIFPISNKLKAFLRNDITKTIYHNAQIALRSPKGKKRIMLNVKGKGHEIPMTLISAGQREFLPYLISLYYLLPAGKVESAKGIKSVVIEEPEMGLHPLGIRTFLLTVLDLLNRNYTVYISTHSVDLMNYVWALNEIQLASGSDRVKLLAELLEIKKAEFGTRNLENVSTKKTSVHFFDLKDDHVDILDISDLSLDNEEQNSWGGFLKSADKAADVVASIGR